ncbi:myosin-2 essential light chain-like [Culicoides brevitarsis]|uniref:myosin-2 essential light chain-like n=1 Tax=Culicoides brevitarsis TaxID=469753 RepID=UPI00307B9BBA
MSKLTNEQQQEEFQEAFNLFDDLGDGKIHHKQIGECLRALGLNPTEADVKKVIEQFKDDDRISYETFLPIYEALSKKKSKCTQDEFVEELKQFDRDGSGAIGFVELKHHLMSMGDKLTDEEADQLLTGLEDAEGMINYENFVKMVMSG